MSIFSKLFGSRAESPMDVQKNPRDIVADFGALLENAPPLPSGMVADVNELPHPKEDIKKSILVLMVSISDVTMQKHLFEAYYSLACWQPGVGSKRIEIDLSAMPLGGSKAEMLDGIESFRESYEKWNEWEPIVNREQEELLEDLAKLGFR